MCEAIPRGEFYLLEYVIEAEVRETPHRSDNFELLYASRHTLQERLCHILSRQRRHCKPATSSNAISSRTTSVMLDLTPKNRNGFSMEIHAKALELRLSSLWMNTCGACS